jgi:hypothetical protein
MDADKHGFVEHVELAAIKRLFFPVILSAAKNPLRLPLLFSAANLLLDSALRSQ